VCLGHQSIGAAFGGDVARPTGDVYGKTSMIHHDGRRFTGVDNPFEATYIR
jgi:anthranilate/para-aminobenzoate synthase component II